MATPKRFAPQHNLDDVNKRVACISFTRDILPNFSLDCVRLPNKEGDDYARLSIIVWTSSKFKRESVPLEPDAWWRKMYLHQMRYKVVSMQRKNSMRTMLKMQNISPEFRAIIAGSTKIKRFLFMATPMPRATPDYSFVLDSNPALRGGVFRTEAFPFHFTWTTWRGEHLPPDIADTEEYHKKRNYARLRVHIRPVVKAGVPQAPGEASWRRMYLDQSAYKVLEVRTVCVKAAEQRSGTLDMLNPTASEIYDALFKETVIKAESARRAKSFMAPFKICGRRR